MTDQHNINEDAENDEPQAKPKPIMNGISSSISGPGVGDEVAMKRANLLNDAAHGDPKLGRRPAPEPYDPRPRRIMYLKGILAGAVVIVLALVFLIVAGSANPVS